MGQVISIVLRLLRFKPSATSNDQQTQTQTETESHLILPVQQQQVQPSDNCTYVDIVIDKFDPLLQPLVVVEDDKPLLSTDLLITTASSSSDNQTDRFSPANTVITPPRVGHHTPTLRSVVTKSICIGPYKSCQKILLVGEGDFSFSACLARAFGSASNIVATSLNTKGYLKRNYGSFSSNMNELVTRGCIVLHDIDATKMATHPQLSQMKFDRVVYNFPHSGFDHKTPNDAMRQNKNLVRGFMRNAKKMINDDGQIHIRHKCNYYFLQWDIPKIGSDQGLFLIQEITFNRSQFPGYHTKYGYGGDNDFNCNPSKTYSFGLAK